ncbi:ABC transporter permease [Saccharicrinis sp. FJH62]|uniref:ABC transporter permease n=1 Tax=Saccharicrinis sp. FJH62 TaxID=3344657 RepID=UPI0035D44521
MNSTNLKIAFRTILKNKIQTIISVAGLGIGLGSIILLSVLAIHEYSFDQFIPEKQNVYRVLLGNDCAVSYPLGEVAKTDIPGIKDFFRYYQSYEIEFKDDKNNISLQQYFSYADPSIFKCLGIKMRYGLPASNRSEVAISEEMANKHFSSQSPIGAHMLFKINNMFVPLTVCGVYKTFPKTSTIAPNYLANIDLTEDLLGQNNRLLGEYQNGPDQFQSWDRFNYFTYLVLSSNVSKDQTVASLQKYKKYITSEKKKDAVYDLQPVTDIYLKSADIASNYYTRLGNSEELKYYIGIASLILLIALLNYMLLTRARIATRLKEIGSKKVLGATRYGVRAQIITESFIIVLLSLIPAALVASGGIPFINSTLNRTLDVSVFSQVKTWLIITTLVSFTAIVSGAFIGNSISKISADLLLKGKSSNKYTKHRWSNSFLTVHFAIFMLLMIGVTGLKKQVTYALNNFQSINPDNVVVYELNSESLMAQFDVIKNEIEKVPGVIKTAGSSFVPPFNNFLPVRLKSNGEAVRFDGLIMGQGMIDLLGMQVTEGEPFGEFRTNPREMIFNESAAKQYNLKSGELFNGFLVKGIVKDFNAHSLHSLIEPMVILQQQNGRMRLMAIKTDGKNDATISAKMKAILKRIAPDNMVTSYYLTDQINHFYDTENNQTKLLGAFSLLAILLSIMGLLGMILITTAQKNKEIGVRKVNGATISEIVIMLNRNFTVWVGVAFVIAAPLAWYLLNHWLENFAYKTILSWWIFALPGLLALGIAILTVSFQSWRAATKNPVDSLRYE